MKSQSVALNWVTSFRAASSWTRPFQEYGRMISSMMSLSFLPLKYRLLAPHVILTAGPALRDQDAAVLATFDAVLDDDAGEDGVVR